MYKSLKEYDYLLVGAGVIGLTIAYELLKRDSENKIALIDKENDVGAHASGRNSGVLHAGFYYTADSLKARFTVEGNRLMKEFCKKNNIKINFCKKVVVAQTPKDLDGLEELKRRADRNGVRLEWIEARELKAIDPNIKTVKRALFSPDTATLNPVELCKKLKENLLKSGVSFFFNEKFKSFKNGRVKTQRGEIKSKYLINTAGLYADKIAKQFGFSRNYFIMPFKGIYLRYKCNKQLVQTNVYPVPNLKNPFLDVHFTVTAENDVKIGPTAIPAFWRENYKGFSRFHLTEFLAIISYQIRLFITNRFNFRKLAFEEIKKYRRSYLAGLASKMLHHVDENKFTEWIQPGIRAQLLNKKTLELVQDFVIEGDEKSMHVLNAVSPGLTCSFAFSKYIIDEIERLRLKRGQR